MSLIKIYLFSSYLPLQNHRASSRCQFKRRHPSSSPFTKIATTHPWTGLGTGRSLRYNEGGNRLDNPTADYLRYSVCKLDFLFHILTLSRCIQSYSADYTLVRTPSEKSCCRLLCGRLTRCLYISSSGELPRIFSLSPNPRKSATVSGSVIP